LSSGGTNKSAGSTGTAAKAKVSEEMLASFAKIEDGLAKFVRDNESQMMLSAMADKIQQNAKEVSSTKDRWSDRAETCYDDLDIRHSLAGSEEKITIAVVMKRVKATIGTYEAEIAGNTNAINALEAEVRGEILMGKDNMAATLKSSNKRRKTVADEDVWNNETPPETPSVARKLQLSVFILREPGSSHSQWNTQDNLKHV
jgi:hypothetical protein